MGELQHCVHPVTEQPTVGDTMPSPDRQHPALVTILDVLVLVATAAALVLFLGARHRFFIGPIRVTVPDWERLLIFVGVVTAIRWWVGRGLRILPSVERDDRRPSVRAEREHFVTPSPVTREVSSCAAVAMLASLIWLMPHILNIRHVPDGGDPIFSAWRLARLAHQAVHDPTRLFDGNIFHPARATMTYSDPTVFEAVMGLPWLVAGADPLIVANALFIASFPACALAFFYAGWRLTGDPLSGCIAGILGGLSPFKIEHYSHLELQFFFFAPVAVVTLLRMLASPSRRTGALFGAVVACQWLASMYLGLMLLVFLTPFALVAAVVWRITPTRPLATAGLAAAAILLSGVAITAIPFVRTQDDRGPRPLSLVTRHSAVPRDYAVASNRLALYRKLLSPPEPQPERDLFPGGMPLVLAVVGGTPPVSMATAALIAATAVSFDGSLGTNGLIYHRLYQHLLPFRGLRVPARFAALVGTGLILLSAFGARRVLMLAGTRRTRILLCVVLASGAIIEGRSRIRVGPYFSELPPIYSRVDPGMVLAELPMGTVPDFAYMYFSTFHWARLINGRSGHAPAAYAGLERAAEEFPGNDLLPRLRERGATHLTVNCGMFFADRANCPPLLDALDRSQELERITTGKWQGEEVRLYAFR